MAKPNPPAMPLNKIAAATIDEPKLSAPPAAVEPPAEPTPEAIDEVARELSDAIIAAMIDDGLRPAFIERRDPDRVTIDATVNLRDVAKTLLQRAAS